LAGGLLTERERELLRHEPGLLSDAEIAIQMSITIHTVKAHLKSIYRKLAGVREEGEGRGLRFASSPAAVRHRRLNTAGGTFLAPGGTKGAGVILVG